MCIFLLLLFKIYCLSYQRDLKDAQTIIKHAKLDESQLTEVTQVNG